MTYDAPGHGKELPYATVVWRRTTREAVRRRGGVRVRRGDDAADGEADGEAFGTWVRLSKHFLHTLGWGSGGTPDRMLPRGGRFMPRVKTGRCSRAPWSPARP